MNRITLTILLTFIISNSIAQKLGHFSSEYIVAKMPTYQQAQNEINMLSIAWMDEVKNKYIEIGRLENKLEAEKILLTQELKLERENEIELKVKSAIDYQYQVFGPEGLLFLKKKNL